MAMCYLPSASVKASARDIQYKAYIYMRPILLFDQIFEPRDYVVIQFAQASFFFEAENKNWLTDLLYC